MACPNINSQEWKDLVKAQGVDTAYYLWDKYEGSVPEKFNKSLEDTLVDGFLKDFNITATEYKSLKEDIGLDAVAASDLLAKSIAYNEGENITPEVAYFAYTMLGKDNSKIRSDLKYLINKWDKYAERFKYHSNMVSKREGFIKDKDRWKNKVRDLVILDFLTEKLNQQYFNPKEFEKTMDSRWTKEDFTVWGKIMRWFESLLLKFSSTSGKEKLDNTALSIVDEILNRNYEYFDYKLADGQIQKYYNDTIASDEFAKTLVEYGQNELGLILTGSLAVRRAGAVYRTADESIHDIDWVVSYDLNTNSDENESVREKIIGYQHGKSKEDRNFAADMAKPLVKQLSWYKDFVKKYPSFKMTHCFYGAEHDSYESLTVSGVIDGEFYESDGYHDEEVSFYKKDPLTKKPIKVKETQRRKHKKFDVVKDTGYVVDFFLRLQPKQEEHENYFKLWKEIFIAKLKMGRSKDFIDWKVFFPYLKSQDSFNFNYEGFRHINYESSENYALEETNPITPIAPTEPSQESDNTNVFHSKSRLVKEQEDAKSIYFNEVYGKDLSENDVNRINSKLAKLSDRIGDQTWSLRESASGNLYIAGYKNGLVTSTDYYSPYANGIFRQTEGVDASTSSPETIDKVKEILKKIGVDIQDLVKYAKETGLDTKGVNGIADLTRKIIAIAEGKEGAALTEEMVHVATAILEQLNPKMVTEMIAKIDRFAIYKKVLNAYKSDKTYQLANGKPDIRKIKKEAVDKLIAELIINQNEGDTEFPELRNEINRSFVRRIWNDILDFFRGMYKKANINIFEEAATKIQEGVGTIDEVKTEGGVFKQKNTDIQEQIQAKLLNTKNSIDKKEGDPNKTDPLLLDAEEANNFYEMTNPDGTKDTILKRVTDRVKAWYADRFRDKTFTPQEQAFNELKREFGIQGHLDFEEIHSRYYNKDGTKRDKPGQRPTKFNLPSDEMYTKLENYYKELIKTFPKDTLIMSEVIIYDKKEKEAGTLDFLAIEPSGKAHILDWKFMHIKGDDVAWFKQGAFNIQLGRYKQILKDNYGITEFGMTRAIPISMEFKPKNKFDISLGFKLSGIAIGSVKASDIEELYLIPISEETESTGEKDLDRLIVKLNALLKQIEKEEVTEQEREFRIERLNTLRQTIRIVQATSNIAPLIDTIEVMRKEGDKLVNDYEITYKNRSASSKDSVDKDLSDFSDDMNNFISLSSLFTNIGDDIGHLIYNEEMKSQAKTAKQKEELADRREALDKLREESSAIYRARNEIKEVALAFADKHIGQRNLVTGLTRAEAVIKGLSSLFRGVSELPLASLNILYKVTRMAQGKASQDALVEVKELMAIREAIMKKGGDARKFIQQMYQKDKEGSIVNKLIYKYKEEFRKTVDDKFALGGDRKWLLENIDIEEYKKEALPVIKNRIEQIKKQVFPGTPTQVKAMKQKLMQEVLQKYDVTRIDFTGGDNYIIKRHPLPVWYSDEYKAISKDEDLSKLYEFIVKFNEKAKDVGYINNNVLKTFLPFVRKSMAEEISFNNVLSVMGNLGSNLQMKVETAGYGKINEITGAVENSVPKYYTHDFSRKENGVNDYSDVSEDLFKNLILYIQQVNKYKYMTEVEGQLKLVKTVEEFKGHHLQTNQSGDVVIGKNGKPEEVKGNEENTRMYDDFLRVLLYDQKYVLSDADTPLKIGKVLNFVKSGVNKVAGREVWKINEDANPTSLIKTMDAANRAFQVKTLGLEIIPGLVNLFGGQAQMSAQSGNYFKYKEFLSNERKIVSQEFGNSEEKEIFIQLMDVFMPMKDDPAYEEFKKAGLTKLTNANLGDMLMITMRFPEQIMEKATFLTLLQNSIVVDGKIVNIREYVKGKYKGRSASSTSYKESKEKIEKEVEELKKTKSIAVTRKLENGKLIIPGLDISNRTETQRLTNLTRRISRNAMGGVSDGDVNRMSMSVWTKSMMVFKGWIPKLADTRFSELRKISDDFSVEIGDDGMAIGEKYDIGRLRLLGYVMMTSFRDKASNIRNIIEMNDAGIAAIDKLYTEFAEKYKKRTGEDFNMSKDDFTDMVRANLGNQLKELAILAALIGATLAMGFMAPPDDADKATKNFYRYSQKVVDKFVSEISFFYNPIEFEKILSGSMFPAMGLITDITKFFKHFWLQTTGLDFDADTSFDDVRKKAQPIKYGARVLPLFKSMMTYGSILSSDFAKEFDITIQRESNIR